ncbi:MarR family winged helix-turn-helix transcriptional regulator [Croceivirga radicis]|uniref:MarR family transcriptional regulator n=1 Tax=Croceivirga radicis TaxID=1929488 RepID=A0A1V6LN79_9FLAO|nr:MarR family transcriptional regulator [Croceivirga radicis]OQD41660.1 MarR family transcriptional regulator [Croceivirga radicis]
MNVEKIIKTKKEIPLRPRTLIHMQLIVNSVSEKITAVLKPFDVSTQQFNVLRILRGQNGKPANLSTISERMVSKMSNTTRLVDKLLAKEYVERKICPENRRKVEISITTKGIEALEHMDAAMLQAENELTANLTDQELIKLNQILDKF